MIILAPYPDTSAIIVLPRPQLQNGEATIDEREYLVMMDKSVHSNIKRSDSMVYTYTFSLTREKFEELLEFIRLYSARYWQWQDQHGAIRVGNCLNGQSEGSLETGPHKTCGTHGYSANEKVTFSLELETCVV